MSFFLAYGAEKLANKIAEKKRRSQVVKNGMVDSSVQPDTWDGVLYELKHSNLIELRLGWHDCCFVSSSRSLPALAKALKSNTSLRRVSLGWHWSRREVLFQVLVTLADSIRPQQLQSIHICLNDWVPVNVLARFLQSQTSLSSLDLQVITVNNVPWKGLQSSVSSSSSPLTSYSSTTGDSHSNRSHGQYETDGGGALVPLKKKKGTPHWGDREITHIVPLLLESLETNYYTVLSELRLVDCELDDAAVTLLAEEMQTSSLSVRGNRRLSGEGCAKLIRAQQFSSLDLSLCDLEARDFVVIAQALQHRRSHPLQQLLLCGNYRMQLMGLLELLKICPLVVHTLDLSFCELSEVMTVCVLQSLINFGKNPQVDVRLRQLSLHGSHSGSLQATNALVTLLRQNSPPLRLLALEDTKNDRKYVSANQMLEIADAMEHNYEMEYLSFDFFKSCNEQQAWKVIDHWQTLNRAGRRLLCPQAPLSSRRVSTDQAAVAKAQRNELDEWINLLQGVKAEGDLEGIYWIIRNSAGRFR